MSKLKLSIGDRILYKIKRSTSSMINEGEVGEVNESVTIKYVKISNYWYERDEVVVLSILPKSIKDKNLKEVI